LRLRIPDFVVEGGDAQTSSPGTPGRPQVNPLWKTRMCTFFMRHGGCRQGDSCIFAHGPQELREAPDFTRTAICPDLLRTGVCPREGEKRGCAYAHSREELRSAGPSLMKTRMCDFHRRGVCVSSSACRFAHEESELVIPGAGRGQEKQPAEQRPRPPPPALDAAVAKPVDAGAAAAAAHAADSTAATTPAGVGSPIRASFSASPFDSYEEVLRLVAVELEVRVAAKQREAELGGLPDSFSSSFDADSEGWPLAAQSEQGRPLARAW